MKNKYIIGLFFIGVIYSVVGILFKILHYEIGYMDGNFILIIGILTKILACVLFFSNLLKNRKNN
jgi:hypothetical protein